MIFEGVEFDDYTVDEYDKIKVGTWSQVCREHSKKFRGKKNGVLSKCGGEPVCGVKGCNKIAKYYIDFPEAE